MTSFTIAGKVAIVTGGASGLGYCFAARLLEKGAKVRLSKGQFCTFSLKSSIYRLTLN